MLGSVLNRTKRDQNTELWWMTRDRSQAVFDAVHAGTEAPDLEIHKYLKTVVFSRCRHNKFPNTILHSASQHASFPTHLHTNESNEPLLLYLEK